MEITDVHLICFSPTHTSRRVGEAIVRGLGCAQSPTVVDLTLHPSSPLVVPQEALTVVALPVYGGHLPPLALERMQAIRSAGGPVVVVVVYGNRAYEKALVELDAWATGCGFRVIAGGTFIGEHSYSNDLQPIAAGRPDADDLAYAELFGQKVRTKVAAATDLTRLYAVDVARIQRPRQPFFPLLRFLYQVVKLRKSGVPLPRVPKADESLCTHCGFCAKHCPAAAIPVGDECRTMFEKCIRCCACVKGCPSGGRSYYTPFASLLATHFRRPKENRIIL